MRKPGYSGIESGRTPIADMRPLRPHPYTFHAVISRDLCAGLKGPITEQSLLFEILVLYLSLIQDDCA